MQRKYNIFRKYKYHFPVKINIVLIRTFLNINYLLLEIYIYYKFI